MYDWRLIFGAREVEYGSNKPVKAPAQERYVEKIVIHERYTAGLEANDIALLKITPPIVCGHVIGPGCLPQFRAGPPRVPQTCWVAGWGFLKENGEYGRGSRGHCWSLPVDFEVPAQYVDAWLRASQAQRGVRGSRPRHGPSHSRRNRVTVPRARPHLVTHVVI